MTFKIINRTQDLVIVKLYGDISIEEKLDLKERFFELIDNINGTSVKRMQVDLKEVLYVDSIGISLFLKLKSELEKNNLELDLLNVPNSIIKILKMLSLDKHFNIFDAPVEEK